MSKIPNDKGMVDPRNHPGQPPGILPANDPRAEAEDSEQRSQAKEEKNPPIHPAEQDNEEGLVDPRDETSQPPTPPNV